MEQIINKIEKIYFMENFNNIDNDEEKQLILEWRNSERIRLKMLNQNKISFNKHLLWLEQLKNIENRKYYLFKINNIPVGVFYYTDIDNNNNICWCGSYIGNINYIGYGILLNYIGFNQAFNCLNINKINIAVLKNNKRVYQMHKTIFHAKDNYEDDNIFYLYIEKDSWNKNITNISPIISNFYGEIGRVNWSN